MLKSVGRTLASNSFSLLKHNRRQINILIGRELASDGVDKEIQEEEKFAKFNHG